MLRISGEARSYPSILSFMVRLEKTQVLTGVHLISHQLREELAERPVQFTLAASWRTAP
jgi:Tfp pilus assembly protein PilN